MAGNVESVHEERGRCVVAYELFNHGVGACLSETALEIAPDTFY